MNRGGVRHCSERDLLQLSNPPATPEPQKHTRSTQPATPRHSATDQPPISHRLTQIIQSQQLTLLHRHTTSIRKIANDPDLGDELIFRGGTCLHKLHLNPSLRYSEDLDYVRRTAGGIGELLAALRRIGERLDMKVGVDVSKYPKVKFRSPSESGNGTMRINRRRRTHHTPTDCHSQHLTRRCPQDPSKPS